MRLRHLLTASIALFAASILAGCGGDDGGASAPVAAAPVAEGPIPLTVSKAACGPSDVPESGLQGQVPASVRAAGFKGYNCNLTLIGQSRNEGASWQHAYFKDQAYPDVLLQEVRRV